jgi:alpha-beta hydrolase superfamily lysophospholipase
MKGDAVEACHGPGVRERDADGGEAPGRGPAFALLDAVRDVAAQAAVPLRWHLVGHSAGTIFHCRLFDWFVRNGVRVASMSFVAPAVSCALFRRTVMANAALVERFGLHTMPDADERDDDCMKLYSKSLLYLVSGSFENDENRQLLGLDRNIRMDHRRSTRHVDPLVSAWLRTSKVALDFHRPERTDPTLHGSYDDDPATLEAIAKRL